MRVLYIEDNCQLREAIGGLLECEGREVVTCISAEEALELEARGTFDLVITDVTLPGMSGLELSTQLLGQNAQRWIVLCSGHHLDDEVRALGPNVHALTKPFGVDDLEDLVNNAEQALRAA